LSIWLILSLQACRPIDRRDVIRLYRLSGTGARDEIKLGADGRYVHLYRSDQSEIVADTGSWDFVRGADGPRLEFSGFRMVYDTIRSTFGFPSQRGYWIVHVDREPFGGVALMVDRDLGLRYVAE
jgi:hypothetical protein